jgi:serine phosphatase RsbU (regulator of sigma subunit)/DNA-binding NarL/FixJ family response regulator
MADYTILCVDDEKIVLDSLRDELRYRLDMTGLSIETADSAEYALEIFQEIRAEGGQVPVVISDQLMPGMKGDAFLIRINEIAPEVRKILLTGQASADAVGNALNKAGLYRFVSKPWNPDDLALTVQEAIRSFSLDAQLDTQVKRTNLLSNVNAYARILSEALDTPTLAERLLEALCRETQADRGGLINFLEGGWAYVFDPQAEQRLQRVSRGQVGRYLSPVLTELAEQKENIQRVADATQSDFLSADNYVQEHQPRSVLAAGIRRQDRLLGVLYLESRSKSDLFDEDAQELIEFVNSQTAISLDNSHLYQELQEKNEKITNSIQYAQRIQQSVLPDPAVLQRYFSDHFITYKPRDIVSGDFYWWAEAHGYLYFSAIDCTGHGVPGAIMTMLANNLIDRAIQGEGLVETDAILQNMRNALRQLLKTEQNSEMKDGMDMALCRLDASSGGLQFSAAQMSMFHISQGKHEVSEYKGNRIPIGERKLAKKEAGEPEFSHQTLELHAGDQLYLYSDGMVDQFGSQQNKKFSTKRFRELLEAISHRSMAAQKEILENRFQIWKRDAEQTDDVLVMGFAL